MNLASIDLNLLVSLDALITARSVTRAATRLGVGQPAMSAALARLRKLVGDPILGREANAMVPTARALDPLHAFAPSELRRRFAVAATDHAALLGSLVVVRGHRPERAIDRVQE